MFPCVFFPANPLDQKIFLAMARLIALVFTLVMSVFTNFEDAFDLVLRFAIERASLNDMMIRCFDSKCRHLKAKVSFNFN
jgi:hypothetical protein